MSFGTILLLVVLHCSMRRPARFYSASAASSVFSALSQPEGIVAAVEVPPATHFDPQQIPGISVSSTVLNTEWVVMVAASTCHRKPTGL